MVRIENKLSELERRAGVEDLYFAISWPDEDEITVNGKRIPLTDFKRDYPEAKEIKLSWGS